MIGKLSPQEADMAVKFLLKLQDVVDGRKGADPDTSYTAKLFNKGKLKIAQKVGEEGVEVALAVTNQEDDRVLEESADLIYHLTVALAERDLSIAQVAKVLEGRHQGG